MKKSLEAISLDKNESMPYLTLGKIYLRKREYQEALPVLKKAARLDGKNPVTWAQMSSVYINTDQYDKALLAGKAALEADPNYAAAYFNLAVAYFKKEDAPRAIANIEKAEALYRERADEHWVALCRQNKQMFLKHFKIRAEDLHPETSN